MFPSHIPTKLLVGLQNLTYPLSFCHYFGFLPQRHIDYHCHCCWSFQNNSLLIYVNDKCTGFDFELCLV